MVCCLYWYVVYAKYSGEGEWVASSDGGCYWHPAALMPLDLLTLSGSPLAILGAR